MNEPPDRQPVVMAVDDTPDNLRLLRMTLEEERIRVLLFPDGASALRAAKRQPPDLFLLDIMMPGMDGFELCSRLKQETELRNVPVIFISALDDIASIQKAFDAGGVDYLPKPFRKEEVIARVRTHLNLCSQRRRIDEQNRELQERNSQLQELQELREQLVHMIIHDLRSPLTGLLGEAELLRLKLKEELYNSVMQEVDGILASGWHLRDMITRILDISRMEANQMPVKFETVDLRELVQTSLECRWMRFDPARLEFQHPSRAVQTLCDTDLVSRIVENLVSNAMKFSGENGRVRVVLEKEENGDSILEVHDNGPGIPPELHGKIFDKFAQVQKEKGANRYSSGLGLTFCKMAAEAQNGSIHLQNKQEGGSVFRLRLPGGSGKEPVENTPG